jgi:hypothetical protein
MTASTARQPADDPTAEPPTPKNVQRVRGPQRWTTALDGLSFGTCATSTGCRRRSLPTSPTSALPQCPGSNDTTDLRAVPTPWPGSPLRFASPRRRSASPRPSPDPAALWFGPEFIQRIF